MPRYPYPKAHRLTHVRQYEAVYGARIRASRGPLTIFGIPNDLSHARLGLSVPRKVGTAPKRNRIKRLLREAFRLMQHDWPAAYDIVINVRPHIAMTLDQYREMLASMVAKLHREWKGRKAAGEPDNQPYPA